MRSSVQKSIAQTNGQLDLFESHFEELEQPSQRKAIELLPLNNYDRIIINSSGGKDSVACTLKLLVMGVPKEKIEIWHQCVDGRPGSRSIFDWPVTEHYVRSFAEAMGLPVYFMWMEEGLMGELLKENARTKGVSFVRGEEIFLDSTKANISTRRMWPSKGSAAVGRWCTGRGKINVFNRVLRNIPEFDQGKYLIVTGERREESVARSKYLEMELDECNTRNRLVHRWRVVINDDERKIWDMFEKAGIIPHPAYHLGYSRCSCMICIFNGPNHWATVREIEPERFRMLCEVEKEIGHTIEQGVMLAETADRGVSFLQTRPDSAEWIVKALSCSYTPDQIFTKTRWKLPIGAFTGNGGGAQ